MKLKVAVMTAVRRKATGLATALIFGMGIAAAAHTQASRRSYVGSDVYGYSNPFAATDTGIWQPRRS